MTSCLFFLDPKFRVYRINNLSIIKNIGIIITMKNNTIILSGVLCSSLLMSTIAHAEWFFRGTANNWGSTELTQVDESNFQTCQLFQNTDGNPRFKIDKLAYWSENYPEGDFTVSANTHYIINFNDTDHTITVT